jgi:hypothetical protein
MDHGLALDDTTLHIAIVGFGVTLDHVHTFHQNAFSNMVYLQDAAAAAFVFAAQNHYRIIFPDMHRHAPSHDLGGQ